MFLSSLARSSSRPFDGRWRWRIILISRRRLEMGGIRALLPRGRSLLPRLGARSQRSLIIKLAPAPGPLRTRDRPFDKRASGIRVVLHVFDWGRGRPQDASLPIRDVPSRSQRQARSVCLDDGGLPPDGRRGLRLRFLGPRSVRGFGLFRPLASSRLGPPGARRLRLSLFRCGEAGSRGRGPFYRCRG